MHSFLASGLNQAFLPSMPIWSNSMDAFLAHCSDVADARHLEEVLSASQQSLGNPSLSIVSQLVSLWELANSWADDVAEQAARCFKEPLQLQVRHIGAVIPNRSTGKSIECLAWRQISPQQTCAASADQLWLLFLQIDDAGLLWSQYYNLSDPLQQAFGETKIDSWLACQSSLSRAVNTASCWTCVVCATWCLPVDAQCGRSWTMASFCESMRTYRRSRSARCPQMVAAQCGGSLSR